MKSLFAIIVATLIVATQGSYVSNSWPSYSAGWNSWNGWNDQVHAKSWRPTNWQTVPPVAAYPYAKPWSSAWPAASLYNRWNGYYGSQNSVQSWGLPLESYGAGWGQQNLVKVVAPVKLNSWGLPWENYGAGAYGWGHTQGLVKSVVPVTKQIVATAEPIYPVSVGVQKVLY
ncbi:uncharacterized protein LOC131436293 [Malaya genurostris]|uniref:uncharacterized protein LOC131436293 n=1 Tax=Malaya genurostris TaxID=325434 RepID=UPI0026F3B32E|nr:uncharacterized protein LOC131436293 [Malaya genurostris]